MRICFLCVVAMVIGGSLSDAVAQPYYYPPPQRGYYGPPPDYYGSAPGGYYSPQRPPSYVIPPTPPAAIGAPAPAPAGRWIAGLPPEDQPESNQSAELPPQFRRQLVAYVTTEPAGTVIIDTPHTFLYLVLGYGKALRYGIGVGRNC
jgi:hypothetical protein